MFSNVCQNLSSSFRLLGISHLHQYLHTYYNLRGNTVDNPYISTKPNGKHGEHCNVMSQKTDNGFLLFICSDAFVISAPIEGHAIFLILVKEIGGLANKEDSKTFLGDNYNVKNL